MHPHVIPLSMFAIGLAGAYACGSLVSSPGPAGPLAALLTIAHVGVAVGGIMGLIDALWPPGR